MDENTNLDKRLKCVVIGAGLAGLLTSWRLQNYCHVTLICKDDLYSSNSALAQGGVAVVMSENFEDSVEKHVQDTLRAGCDINDIKTVRAMIEDGESAIIDLINAGMHFDANDDGRFNYAMEGSQQVPRVLHADGDKTGTRLVEFALGLLSSDVRIITHAFVMEILVNGEAYGIRYLDQNDEEYVLYADFTVLATGGGGGIYETNANNPTIKGDGYAIAKRAGANLRDMEFVQFHPTLLKGTRHLISEAVRGAGGKLIDETGKRIMSDVHPLKDLAPRDVIARTILQQQSDHETYLDISEVKNFATRFPTVYSYFEQYGLDVGKGLMSVEPGAHFFMGGVVTDLQGRTNVTRLYAVGEVASTGLHGANRLASNSLLECIVMSRRVAESIIGSKLPTLQIFNAAPPLHLDADALKLPDYSELVSQISDVLGITRTKESILDFIKWTAQFDALKVVANRQAMQVENILLLARIIAGAAYMRTDSIGAHCIKNLGDV